MTVLCAKSACAELRLLSPELKLSQLPDSGVLTQQEFDEQKQRLLS